MITGEIRLRKKQIQAEINRIRNEIRSNCFSDNHGERLKILQLQLYQADEAIKQTRDKNYGKCECGKIISKRRLKALPTTRCISCAEAQQNQNPRRNRQSLCFNF